MGDGNFLETPSPKPSRVTSCSSSPSFSSSCFSSVLGEKSLELCTESLGNETGLREIGQTNLFTSVPSAVGSADQPRNSPRGFVANKKAAPRTYPPPLTSVSGSESIHFQAHCEDGRMIIEAFMTPTALGSLQAERSRWWLWLGLLEEPDLATDAEPFECQERAQEEEVEGDCLCREEEEEEVGMAGKDCWMGSLSWWLPLLELLPANFLFYHSMRFV